MKFVTLHMSYFVRKPLNVRAHSEVHQSHCNIVEQAS